MKANEKILYRLKKAVTMTVDEIEQYNTLLSNLPETHLTAKQKGFISDLYYKYISGKITYGWGTELSDIEKREKWLSGSRVKTHEAQRMILGNLVFLNSKAELTAEEAADLFYTSLTNRESFTILLQKSYEKN